MTTSNAVPTVSRRAALASLGTAGMGLALAARPSIASAQDATPPAAGEITVVPLGRGLPAAAPGYALSLSRVTFPIGVGDMPHTHPGAALIWIESGMMAMTVLVGQAELTRAGSAEVEMLGIDGEAMLHPGDAVFFPNLHGDVNINAAGEPLVFLAAALYEADQPPITFMEAPGTAPSAAGPLLSAVLDAGLFAVPSGALVLARLIDEPGFSQAITFATNGPAISHVVAGSYTLRSDGPIVLLRRSPDGTTVAESIPAGQEATAQAGETLLHLSGARTEESNQGDIPNERYSFVVAGPDQPTIEDQQGTTNGELLAYIDPGMWTVPESGPVTVTMALEDAATHMAAATPAAGQQVVGELAGPPARRVVVTLTPGELPGATSVDLAVS